MPKGGLLGPPADLVDHRVGQLDGVEVIHHHPGVAKWCHQHARVAAPGVQGDRADAGQPVMGPSVQPAADGGPGAVGHHIQQMTLLQVDQASDPLGGRQVGGLEEAGLVQPEPAHPVQARGVIHQLGAVLSHRPHDGRPADPQVAGDRGHCVGVLTDPPTRLGAGPFGQHRPRPDGGRLLGPGPDPAGRLPTAPEALAPPQHHRPAADRQVAHPDRAPAVRSGPHATTRTADHRGRGLDGKLPFATHELGRDELEAVQAEQPGG